MGNHASLIRNENAGKSVVRRGRHFIEFDNGDGSTRCVVTIDPLHIRNSETEIDTTWTTGDAVYQWRISAADYISEAKDLFNGAPLVRYTNRDTNEWVTLQPRQLEYNNDRGDVQLVAAVQAATAESDGDATLTWAGAFGTGIDYKWINHPKRLIKHLVLNNSGVLPTPSDQILTGGNPVLRHQFQWAWSSGLDVYIDGEQWDEASAITTSGRIEFRLSSGEVVAYFAPASVWDANDERPGGVVQRVSKSGPNILVEVRTPLAWLQSAAYPVTIDPTFTDGYGGDVTTYYDGSDKEDAPNDNLATSNILTTKPTASYRRFGCLLFDVSSLSGATVNSATLYFYNALQGASTYNYAINAILSANSGWAEAFTWNYAQPSTVRWAGDTGEDGGTDAGGSVSGTDWNASNMGTFSTDTSTVGTEFTCTLSVSQVQDWVDGSNYGVILRRTDTTDVLYNFYSSDETTTGYRPKLVVDYSTGEAALEINIAHDNADYQKPGVRIMP